MKKITKSSKSILIDPNEPLILPDGTALVGRIEWFLYALCCLDYQNLPTPMSRIEEFANALITGEIPNIEPQSRAEQFFLAILDGNVSNLPQPQSRSEVLLDKLARGEFDLSDVEPIQSHYELLLAYLIKNGGIGNIDYVLYEFSEAMKTMYNTVEKPFKSLELSGNTKVNVLQESVEDDVIVPYQVDECQGTTLTGTKETGSLDNLVINGRTLVNSVLEDTSNSDYVSFDQDYEGQSFTINGTNEGAIKSAILKGNTLVNMFQFKGTYTTLFNIGSYLYSDNKITIVGNGEGSGFAKSDITVNLEANKTYTFKGNCDKGFNVDNGFVYLLLNNSSSNATRINTGNTTFQVRESGVYYVRLDIKDSSQSYVFSDLMILEGDYTNQDIPYFTGMQSVKMPVLTTTGKNLFNSNNTMDGYGFSVGEVVVKDTWFISNYIEVKPNLSYIISTSDNSVIGRRVNFYDKDKNFVETGRYENLIITVPNNNKIFYMRTNADLSIKSSYQIELGSVATSYEPYKSNILTTTSKNLFDMNRPYDVITDSQATVVQDTNKITVSSAESGTYVSANFILDKDFFAGKTVTGSCLYESDEKDIGTVQIHYQDGNGDHHYQWIRTPKTFTFPNNFIGDVMLCVSANNTGTPQSNTVTVKNIQLELGSVQLQRLMSHTRKE